MFGLAYGFYVYMFSRVERYVLILGVDNAGKTTLLERLKKQYGTKQQKESIFAPERIAPTVGLNIGRIEVSRRIRLVFWDLGGQIGLRSIWEKYFDETHALVYVIDSGDIERLEETKDTFYKILKELDVPVLILANKQDKDDALTVDQIRTLCLEIVEKVEEEDSNLKEIAENMNFQRIERKWDVKGICAITGEGIKEAIDWISLHVPTS
eukprot:TRINITY_DN18689_c0_g1_i1.p1 TRINITY_DN18689_c0_g1~~TRINITY_DN18689_c0_g1_i1.p1  ORF type:complete len:210 (-),score=39.14 TRINITY_DN18689_c0_g1_i1:30-659(-)